MVCALAVLVAAVEVVATFVGGCAGAAAGIGAGAAAGVCDAAGVDTLTDIPVSIERLGLLVVELFGGVTTCIEGMLLVLMATGPSIRFFFTIEPFSEASSIASCKKLSLISVSSTCNLLLRAIL